MTSATVSDQEASLFPSEEARIALYALLKTLGIVEVHAEYSGSGDSGQFDGVAFLDAAEKMVDVAESYWLPWVIGDKEAEYTLETILEDLAWNAIDSAGHSGFYNNDGGQGTLELNMRCSPPTLVLRHQDNVVETVSTDTNFTTGEVDQSEDQ